MTQGLQLSILMTGADTALLSDAAASEAAGPSAEGGLAFGDMLGQLVAPAKTGQDSKGRQLPADISLLSAVSQAVAAATDASATEVMATDDAVGADSALTASILAQLGFTAVNADDKVDGKADGKQAAANSDGELTSSTAELAKSVAKAAVAAEAAEAQNAAEAKTKPAMPDLTLSNGKPEAGMLLSAAQGKAEADADAELSAAASAKKQAAEADQQLSGQQSKLTQAKGATQAAASVGDSTAMTQTEQALTDAAEQAVNKQTTAEQASLPGAGQDGDGKPNTPAIPLHGKTAQQTAKAVSSEPPGNSAQQSLQAADVTNPQLRAAAPSEVAVTTDSQSSKATVLANQAAGHAAGQAGDKVASSTTKTGTEDNPQSSQQQRQQSAAALQDMLQQHGAANSKAAEPAALVRSENAFSAAIAQAEQRQSGAPRPVAKPAASVAEQLKQSLNLLQQDAAGQLRERVNLMVRQNIQVAEIRLDPAGLGQMQIKIDMQQDQASVQFVVQQPQAKELLEQQLPRLRELLQQQGILLSDGQVQQQSQQQRHSAQHSSNGNNAGQGSGEAGDELPATQVQVSASVSERLVDYYA
ncbi:flagellar hook-length control protein FliK [Rheinheimera nanhaiensis]|nr:flagellar hook-length control protein FliK [Rheinheimera nanhaiensis]